jgi:hypothetical protein
MKMFALVALFLPLFAHAATLEDNMKAIGKLYKGISKTASDASQNKANAAAAGQLVTLFNAALAGVPDAVSKLPASSQATALADYQRIIGLEIANATELQADFTAGNNAAAVGVITKMDSSKREGHTKYNPDTK